MTPQSPTLRLVAEGAAHAFEWWINALARLIPDGFSPARRSLTAVEVRADGRIHPLPLPGQSVELRIAPDWLILRVLRFPAAVRENLTAAIAAELDRVTPFTAEQVLTQSRLRARTGDEITVDLAVLPGRVARPLIDQVAQGGNPVLRLTVSNGPDWLKDRNFLPRQRRSMVSAPLSWPVAALVVAGLAAPSIGQFWQSSVMTERRSVLQAEAAKSMAMARELGARRSGLTGLDAVRAAAPSISRLLADLTQALPPSAYLDDIAVEGDQVTLSGYGQSSAALIPALTGSGHFTDAHFAGTVVRDTERGLERFQINAQYQPGGERAP